MAKPEHNLKETVGQYLKVMGPGLECGVSSSRIQGLEKNLVAVYGKEIETERNHGSWESMKHRYRYRYGTLKICKHVGDPGRQLFVHTTKEGHLLQFASITTSKYAIYMGSLLPFKPLASRTFHYTK